RLKQEKLKANAPKPGARPDRSKKAATVDGEVVAADDDVPATTATAAGPAGPLAGLQRMLGLDKSKSDSTAAPSDAATASEESSAESGSAANAESAESTSSGASSGPTTAGSDAAGTQRPSGGGTGSETAKKPGTQKSGTAHVAAKNRKGGSRRRKGGRPGGRH
ncbi:MAG: membrane protein insertase YidC, partial [Actinomycetota bacterium]|nr:membrane protein insertase YidC [Actinomycetota bacterium]